jgi:Predicted transcriptional regulator with C-terminal CBS domains
MSKLTFKETLILLRKRKGLTQSELAEKAGILREMISNYESGKTTPRESTLRKIP